MNQRNLLTREFFPTLVSNNQLLYFDSASSTQTHVSVINSMNEYYEKFRSNTGRGAYPIAKRASQAIDLARQQVSELIGAKPEQIAFNSGTTQGLNDIAYWLRGAPVVILLESNHNSNIAPWVSQGRSVGNGSLRIAQANENGYMTMNTLRDVLSGVPSGSVLSMSTVNNVTGAETFYQMAASMAEEKGIITVMDLSQEVSHRLVELGASDVDFAVFSAHKMFGPTGVGAIYSKAGFDNLPPRNIGGGCVDVTFDSVILPTGPARHEQGTPSIANIIGFGTAAELISYVGIPSISEQIASVSEHLRSAGLYNLPGCQFFDIDLHSNIHSFVHDTLYSSDIGEILSHSDVAVRTGFMCAHPFARRITGGRGLVRISTAPYNTEAECYALVNVLTETLEKLTDV